MVCVKLLILTRTRNVFNLNYLTWNLFNYSDLMMLTWSLDKYNEKKIDELQVVHQMGYASVSNDVESHWQTYC
jgi:hypothetical protein